MVYVKRCSGRGAGAVARAVAAPALAAGLALGGCLLLTGCSAGSGSQGASWGAASGEVPSAVQATVPEDITALVVETAMAGSGLPVQMVYADEQGEGAADDDSQAGEQAGAAILDEATMSPAQAAAQVLDVSVAVDEAARTVSIAAVVPDTMALADACVAGNALAYLVSANSEVSADGAAVEEMPYEQGPGVLWDSYVCLVSLENESGMLDLDGCKPLDATRIVWQ